MKYTELPEPYRSCLLYLYLYKYEHNIKLYDFLVQHKFPETRARYINPSLKRLSNYITSGNGLHDIIEIERKDPNKVIKELLKKEKCKLNKYAMNEIIKDQPYELKKLNGKILKVLACDVKYHFDEKLRLHFKRKEKKVKNSKGIKREKSIGKDLLKYFKK